MDTDVLALPFVQERLHRLCFISVHPLLASLRQPRYPKRFAAVELLQALLRSSQHELSPEFETCAGVRPRARRPCPKAELEGNTDMGARIVVPSGNTSSGYETLVMLLRDRCSKQPLSRTA
jgi:hypothetical protein